MSIKSAVEKIVEAIWENAYQSINSVNKKRDVDGFTKQLLAEVERMLPKERKVKVASSYDNRDEWENEQCDTSYNQAIRDMKAKLYSEGL